MKLQWGENPAQRTKLRVMGPSPRMKLREKGNLVRRTKLPAMGPNLRMKLQGGENPARLKSRSLRPLRNQGPATRIRSVSTMKI
jgi:hypothetical protein